MQPNIAVVFLALRPPAEAYTFWKAFARHNQGRYDVYVCVDDNEYTIPGYDGAVPIIKMDGAYCESQGFRDTVAWFDMKAVSRDKALLWFSKHGTLYDHVWMLEEDVFVPCLDTLKWIDDQYPASGLLCATHDIVQHESELHHWHWPKIKTRCKMPLPWAKSMICGARLSRTLLATISRYAATHGTLFMDEALYNTLALHNGLVVDTPHELASVVYEHIWALEDIKPANLYHPVKDINKQVTLRVQLSCD